MQYLTWSAMWTCGWAQLTVPDFRMTARDEDALTGKRAQQQHLFKLPNFPTYMGVAEDSDRFEDDILAEMRWFVSQETGLVQLNPLVPLEYVYKEQHNAVVGDIWQRHHDEFADLVAKYKPVHVLEVGGGHGYLATKLLFLKKVQHWTMVDPNPLSLFPMNNLDVVRKFIEDVKDVPSDVDAIIHSHTLEHIYDPSRFFGTVRSLLKPGLLHIFSIPNLMELVKHDQPSLHFEHTILLREEHIDWLLTKYGFEIVEKQYFGGYHSIFYVTRVANEPVAAIEAPPNYYRENYEVAKRWFGHVIHDAQDFAAALPTDKTAKIFVYAAHVGTQYILAAGLPADKLAGVLDNNPDKIGRRLYGHRLRVSAPAILADIEKPYVVLRAGIYDDEIIAQLRMINPRTVFIHSKRGKDHRALSDRVTEEALPATYLRGAQPPSSGC